MRLEDCDSRCEMCRAIYCQDNHPAPCTHGAAICPECYPGDCYWCQREIDEEDIA